MVLNFFCVAKVVIQFIEKLNSYLKFRCASKPIILHAPQIQCAKIELQTQFKLS